jgi:hypothetical protein
MSDVKNIWVLKQPVTKTDVYYNDARLPYFGIDELKGIDFSCIHPDVFYSFFQPLDVESLTEQLGDILQNFWQDEAQDLDDSVAEILELIGITKEQK